MKLVVLLSSLMLSMRCLPLTTLHTLQGWSCWVTDGACKWTTALFWSEAPLQHASLVQMKPPQQDAQSAEDAADMVRSVDGHLERLHDVAVEISYLLEFVSINMRVRRQLILNLAVLHVIYLPLPTLPLQWLTAIYESAPSCMCPAANLWTLLIAKRFFEAPLPSQLAAAVCLHTNNN